MERGQVMHLPNVKIKNDDVEAEFELEVGITSSNERQQEINDGLKDVDAHLAFNNKRLEELNKEIDRLTNHADGIDNMVAVASGILAGLVDSFWVGAFSMERGKAWSNEKVNKFVQKVARAKGYECNRLEDAIKFLEDNYSIPSDNTWSGKGVGISPSSHRLDDLAHHPTPIGLFFSILTQFTKKAYFQNRHGDFLPFSIEEDKLELIGHNIPSKIFAGTVNWFFHLVSDMSGTNKTAGKGMGIPGPIVSLLKEASLLPGLNKTDLPQKINDVFVKERFDLRSELAVGHELGRQTVPVIINEVIVRAFYFIRRFIMELKEKKSLAKVNWRNTLPWRNRTIVRMLTIATGTFTLVDLGDAAIRGAMKSGGNTAMFATQFILHVNFVGVGRFAVAIGTDTTMGAKRNKLRNERLGLLSEQLHLMNAKVYYLQANAWIAAETTEQTINETIEMADQAAKFAVEAWEANEKSFKNISTYKKGIEKHNDHLIDDIEDILKWG